jgi:hypothetical protein
MPGEALKERFRIERRVGRRSAAARALFWILSFGCPAALLAVLHSRLTEAAPGAAVDRLVLAWGLLAFAAIAAFCGALMARAPSDAALALALDRRHAKAGLFSAAAFVLRPEPSPGPLGALVLAQADSAVSGLPLLARVRHLRLHLKRIALFLLLSILVALVPGGPRGALSGIGGGGADGPAKAEPGPESRGAPEAAAESRNDAGVALDELVTLTLKSDHQIYGLNSEISLGVALETKRPIAADVPLELMLAITDGLPSPDVGFGPGFRPVPLRLGWSVPKEQGAVLKQWFPMKETMQALGIYKPGVFTCEVFALPAGDGGGGSVSGGVRSNELTFQVAENKEDLQSRVPQGQGQTKQPEKKAPDESTDEKGGGKSKSRPKLGDPERLKEAQRVASLVQPIVNPGPTIEKDVSVFERERGGPPAPLPVPRKPHDDTPARTFLRRPEVPVVPPELSAEERDVLRKYFDSIRAQKKL